MFCLTCTEVQFQGKFLRPFANFSFIGFLLCFVLLLSFSLSPVMCKMLFAPHLTTKCVVKVFIFVNMVGNATNIFLTCISLAMHEIKHIFCTFFNLVFGLFLPLNFFRALQKDQLFIYHRVAKMLSQFVFPFESVYGVFYHVGFLLSFYVMNLLVFSFIAFGF